MYVSENIFCMRIASHTFTGPFTGGTVYPVLQLQCNIWPDFAGWKRILKKSTSKLFNFHHSLSYRYHFVQQ